MSSNRIKRPVFSRILAGTVLVGSLAFAAQAQAQQQGQAGQTRPERSAEGRGGRGEKPDPAQMVERRVTRLTEELKLTSGQTTAVRQILLDEQKQMETLRPEGLGGRGRNAGDSAARGERRQRPDSATMAKMRAQMEASREQMKALRTRTDARITAVLSSNQRAAYKELVAKRDERAEGSPGRGGPGRGGRGGQRQAPPPAK